MAPTSNKTIFSHRQWFVGLLTACLLVFQISNIVHSLDVAAHEADPDCEICDLFVGSNDDVDALPAANAEIFFTPAIAASKSFENLTVGSPTNARQIRAPPYSS